MGILRSGRNRLAKVWGVLLAVAFLTVLYVSIVFHLLGYSADY